MDAYDQVLTLVQNGINVARKRKLEYPEGVEGGQVWDEDTTDHDRKVFNDPYGHCNHESHGTDK